ncbi:hypothetical protein BT93_I0384 [Corymbia citriodora subsp. variegata]|nr:hypothetical protein BT93_I0384 [Corymbia citriodora subsp. variegata]
MADANVESNPLLQDFEFPPYNAIEAEHVHLGMQVPLKKLGSDLQKLVETMEPSWPKLVEPLEKIMDRFNVVWGIIKHLKNVKDTAELRAAIKEAQAEKVDYQRKPIYDAFKALQESPNWKMLSDAQKRVVEKQIKEAVLNGVALEDGKSKDIKIKQELKESSERYDENVLDATKKFKKLITDKKDIEGLPNTTLALAAQTAVSEGHEDATTKDGPWVITLDAPCYNSIMRHARNRDLREEIYRAYVTLASSGDMNNTLIIDQILKLRMERAKLLGYNNYAEVWFLKQFMNS